MHHHRLLALVSGLLALVIIAPAGAQSWRGSEAVGVQASDSKGKPIAGARVVLTYQGRGSESNPPEVATNSKGRAVAAGLATGSWQLEVQHPDFLSYVAVFELKQGKKPSINASFLEASGRSLTPMKVKLSKGNPRDASSPLPTREARFPAPPPSEPDRPTVAAEAAPTSPPVETTLAPEPTAADEPTPQEQATPEPEPSAETPVAEEPLTPSSTRRPPPIEETTISEVQKAPVPAPTPAPAPEPEQGELPAQQQASPPTLEPSAPPAPAAEPQPVPTVEATATELEPEIQPDRPAEPIEITEVPVEREPEPEPEIQPDRPAETLQITEAPVEREPVAAPSQELQAEAAPLPVDPVEQSEVETPPAPAAATLVPADKPAISSYRDGSCEECRIGEWAVIATQAVAAGSVPCPVEATQGARDASDSLGNSMQLELFGFVGPTADGSSLEALASAEPEISKAYRQQLAPYLGGSSNCQAVSVVLPKTVRFAGFRYEAFDASGGGECAPDRGCSLPGARWLASPVVQRGFNATVVWGIFENVAGGETRFASLKVYFRPPSSSWKPPTR
ncbi:MAG: hypothetical protein GWO83_00280 [Bacteroidia bacterium]|nr:hypothetical protein [Bacteroidia bacterium]